MVGNKTTYWFRGRLVGKYIISNLKRKAIFSFKSQPIYIVIWHFVPRLNKINNKDTHTKKLQLLLQKNSKVKCAWSCNLLTSCCWGTGLVIPSAIRPPAALVRMEDWWNTSVAGLPKEDRRRVAAWLLYTAWHLWNERNRRVFRGCPFRRSGFLRWSRRTRSLGSLRAGQAETFLFKC